VSDTESNVRERVMSSMGTQSGQQWSAIQPLSVDDAHRLRLGWTSRFERPDIRNLLAQHPNLSQWNPETGEYLIAGNWRHRDDVAAVLELSAQRGASDLLRAFAEASAQAGKRVALMSEHQESRNPGLYARAGFDLIEHIMIYELPKARRFDEESFTLNFQLMTVDVEAQLEELLELDHEAFPWLWWNSPNEFTNYGRARGVLIYGARDESGRLVSYIGVTRFRAWGHLDRIAVRPELQGQGIGLQSLEWAIHILAASGARRIGLSTQARNERSRLLYERYGFRRSPQQDYYLYGRWLTDDAYHDEVV
jgi:ribosomal protein S18 acetylase RimI-like enzyme